MVTTQIRDMRSKLLDLETSTDKLLAMFGEKLETIQIKVDRMEEGHVLREYTDEQAKIMKDDIMKNLRAAKKDYN